MIREFIMTPVFDMRWDKLGLTDDDLIDFQNLLMKNPFAGDIIQESGGARKIRFAFSDSGKSGGVRVIYVDFTHLDRTFLLLCYAKKDDDDLTAQQKKQLKTAIKELKEAQ